MEKRINDDKKLVKLVQVKKTVVRVFKLLGKAILGLLVFVFVTLSVCHIPMVQQKMANTFLRQFSAKIGSIIELNRFEFSVFGHLEIDELTLWDPDSNKIVTVGKIRIQANVFELLTGQVTFEDLTIENVRSKLIQDKDGLNLQFIFDAFRNSDTLMVAQQPSRFVFRSVNLRNIAVDFTSLENGLSVVANLLEISGKEVVLVLSPNEMTADSIILHQTVVHVLSKPFDDKVTSIADEDRSLVLIPDLDFGIDLEIGVVSFTEGEFAYHEGEIRTTTKFDPAHIELRDIQIQTAAFRIRKDTCIFALQEISAKAPGCKLGPVNSNIAMDRHQIEVSNLKLAFDRSRLEGDLKVSHDLAVSDFPAFHISAKADLFPQEIGYFLADSILQYFSQWENTVVTLEGESTEGKAELRLLKLESGKSRFTASGTFTDIWDRTKLSWKDLTLEASVGSAFKQIIYPLAGEINVPPEQIGIHLNSTGNLSGVYLDAQMNTTWGNMTGIGTLIPSPDEFKFDLDITGDHLSFGKRLEMSWLGPINIDGHVKGILGEEMQVSAKGMIKSIALFDDTIYQIALEGSFEEMELLASFSIGDPRYVASIQSEISIKDTIEIALEGLFSDFALGELLHLDSTFLFSGAFTSSLAIGDSTFSGNVKGHQIVLQNAFAVYPLDTMLGDVFISPTSSQLEYRADYGRGMMTSNFDIRTLPTIFQTTPGHVFKMPEATNYSGVDRALNFSAQLDNVGPLLLLGIPVDVFTSVQVDGKWDEQARTMQINAFTEDFDGYGVLLDTLEVHYMLQDSVALASLNARNLVYNAIRLGDMDFDMRTAKDSVIASLLMSNDSVSWLGFETHILPKDSSLIIYPNKLIAFEQQYSFEYERPIVLSAGNMVFDDFVIAHDSMSLSLNGDRNAFELNCQNFDLTGLNPILSQDSAIINGGMLNGIISYSRDQHLDLRAQLDRLCLYHSMPLQIDITAETDSNRIPFQCLVSSEANMIDIGGRYFLDRKEVDATVSMDLAEPKSFSFLYAGVMDEVHGTVRGEASINGAIEKPVFEGYLNFLNVGFTTAKPSFSFYLLDDTIAFDNQGLRLDQFRIFDQQHHPLTISGVVTNNDYKSISYDLHMLTDYFGLIDKPYSASDPLTGLMVIGSEIHLTGGDMDADITAILSVRDTTNLTLTFDDEADELLKTEGIIQFVEPGLLFDTILLQRNENLYDSLLARIPNIKIHGQIKVEDNASLRIVPDAQSGDYFEVAGKAQLEFSYDRTGNPFLSGEYIVSAGVYRLSFYDLVRKDFQLKQSSSINWSGSPEAGALDIKATNTVQSNSLGLIGDEISDNEKSIYKKSLDYEVGINIKGVVEKPIVSFSLDLPAEDKINYPVLANKLERLMQPEFQSDLNKQVFGLLVLGGFLPEGAGADENQSQIATNALYNSVNSLMSSQLNRLAGQYIKGVDIDVGLQSYSDYSTPGGKTQTAMDFHVSKSIMDDRLSFEVGGDFDISGDQSGSNTGNSYRGDIAIIYDLTGNGDKQLKLFNNESYDIVYQEVRNTGISLIFIREFNKDEKRKKKSK